MPKTAIVIGATGLIGNHLVRQLIRETDYEKIKILHRHSTGIEHKKIEEHIVDFDHPEKWKELVKGDVLFSAMGTTIRKAGGKSEQYKIDYTYQYQTAETAAKNKVPYYVLVSSSGADPQSKIFYSRMKGELDDAVQELDFKKIIIMRPSILKGQRPENRLGEKVGLAMASVFTKIPGLKKYKPIKGKTVARAMINAINQKHKEKTTIYTLDEIFNLVKA